MTISIATPVNFLTVKKMNDNQRLMLFFGVCLLARSLVAFATWKSCNYNKSVQVILGISLFFVATGLFYNFLIDKHTGVFGGVVWWKNID